MNIQPNTIHNGDCLEIMPHIKSHSIDMILADLPYGTTNNKWDSIIDLDQLWKEYKRIIKPNCAIVLTAMQPFSSKLIASNYKMFKYEWIWNKKNTTGFLNAKKQPLRQHESILIFYSKQPTYNQHTTLNSRKVNHTFILLVHQQKFIIPLTV